MEPSSPTPEELDLELDPDFEALLAEVQRDSVAEVEGMGVDLEAMLAEVRQDVARADAGPVGWLRSRSTMTRRVIGFAGALAILGVGLAMGLRGDLEDYGAVRLVLGTFALGTLMGLAIHQALRPLHEPPLSANGQRGIVGASLAATCVLALWPSAHGGPLHGEHVFAHAMPCLRTGLLVGLPVYFLLRLLDRSPGSTAPFLAACAAGLIGNLVLQHHCANSDAGHLMLGHVSVLVLFLAGLAAVHWLTQKRA